MTDTFAPPAIVESRDFDVIALVGSAGAGAAGLQVLRDLPPGFGVPLVVAFHLAPDSLLEQMYARLPFRVEWARHGARLEPGKLLICPPRQFLELLPDGSCALSPCDGGAVELPLDRFLESLARSFADRAVGVVLTGMGSDGAAGALELHRAGGRVVVQSEASAEFPSMPASAIAAGAAGIVIPLPELGQLVGELVANTPRQRMRSEVETIRRVFGEDGEMAARAREVDWSRAPLGPAIAWPETLRVAVRSIVDSPTPQAVWWGPQLLQVYNDAWCALMGVAKHPGALGAPASATWSDTWRDIGPIVGRVLADGESRTVRDYPLAIERGDYLEEVFATLSYSPLRGPAGDVQGVLLNAWETTGVVVAQRRVQLLRALSARLSGAPGVADACASAAAALEGDPQDVPFALFYLLDERRKKAALVASAGLEPGTPGAPRTIEIESETPWPLAAVLQGGSAADASGVLLSDLANRCEGLVAVPMASGRGLPPQAALLGPLHGALDERPLGVIVMALAPHRRFDPAYRDFADLIVRTVDAGIGQGQARERERERRDRMEELDRAKMQFFANVSHEFRTPLTLLLAPLEELMRRQEILPAALAADLEVAVRNARRLAGLVSHLLDFSQVESRRQPAHLVPADLGRLTADVASHFRSAAAAAGLKLHVHCDAALPLVPVDPEMWTTILSNLLANALKFTFEGEIAVTLRALRLHAELEVADTGVGIPDHELPNLFQRFHRVRGTRARTTEGVGIGLSLVQDLVRRMGGQVHVRSREGRGSAFVVWMPVKSFRAASPREPGAPARAVIDVAADLADRATRWMANERPEGVALDLMGAPETAPPRPAAQAPGTIVVIDDNGDMRGYLRRLLGEHWHVETAADAASGLAAMRRSRPDAVLADVMLPGPGGFDLLREMRADAALRRIPVVLVSARAGESSAIEGLTAGADDYVVKPFSPRELLARVRAVMDRSRVDTALRASEQRFRTLFETMDQGCSECELIRDADGRAVSYRVVDVNPAWERLTGLSADACRGRDVREFGAPPEPPWLEVCERVVRENRAERLEQHLGALDAWHEVAFYPAGGDRFNSLLADITERKRAQMRQAFMLQLSDAMRPLRDPVAMQEAAMRLLGAHLEVNRAFYGDAQADDDTLVIGPGFSAGAVPLAGSVRFSDFDADMAAWYLAGDTMVIHDTVADARLSEKTRANLAAIDVRAAVGVPLVKDGRVSAIMSVHQTTPRRWAQAEVSLLEETAERTWAAVERAKAELALRDSEQALRRGTIVSRDSPQRLRSREDR